MSEQASMVGAVRERELDPDTVDALIEKRATARQADDRDREEESFKETTRIYNAEVKEARRHQWAHYYRTLSESFRRRSEELAEKAKEVQSL